MKKQKTPEEKQVRNQALKMTAVFLAIILILGIITVCIFAKCSSFFAPDEIGLYIFGVLIFVTVFSILMYFEFKNEITKMQKGDKDDTTTK